MDLAGSAGDLLDLDLSCYVHGESFNSKDVETQWGGLDLPDQLKQRCHGLSGSSLWVGDGAGDSASSVFLSSVVRKQLYIFPEVHVMQWGKGSSGQSRLVEPGDEGRKEKTILSFQPPRNFSIKGVRCNLLQWSEKPCSCVFTAKTLQQEWG